MQRGFNLTKLLMMMAILMAVFMSCASASGDRVPETKMKAKVQVVDTYNQSNLRFGDIVIRDIDPLYKIGEKIRIGERQFLILEIEERPFKHIVYPEEIRAVSKNPNRPDLLEVYQHGDTLEIRFSHPYITSKTN